MSKQYSEETVYKCGLCNFGMRYATVHGVEEHLKGCMMNPDNKFPATSENFRIKVYPFTPKYKKTWETENAHHEFGFYTRPYDVQLKRELKEEELYRADPHWFPREESTPLIIETDEYKEFMALIDEQEDVEVSDDIKTFVEHIMKEKKEKDKK